MNKIFDFDVTLNELLNLKKVGEINSKVKLLFEILFQFWYNDDLEEESIKRQERIRIGSVDVFLDNQGNLHLDFVTRFSLGNYPQIINLLKEFKE